MHLGNFELTRRAWVLLTLFATVVALLGGSSQPGAVQLVALRPLAALFLAVALYHLTAAKLSALRWPLILLGLLGGWMFVQLIPLPPEIWHRLAGREPIVNLDAYLGYETLWRPISLNPWRGWNALASLIVPLTAILLGLSLRATTSSLIILIAGLGLFNALLGLLQVVTGGEGAFYFYEISNRGSPIGIFANENHAGVFSAITLLALARLSTDREFGRRSPALAFSILVSYLAVLTVGLVGGSRMGFVAIIGALAISMVMGWVAKNQSSTASANQLNSLRKPRTSSVPQILLGVVLLSLPLLFLAFDAAPAFNDMVAQDPLQDLRWQLNVVSWKMASQHWLAGIGFGTYEQAFHLYEPTALMRPSYVNQAHNDWLQWVIEGGVIGVICAAGLAVWIGREIWKLRMVSPLNRPKQIFWIGIIVIIALASVVDYPLRAPAFQVVGAWFLLALGLETANAHATAGPDHAGANL